MSQPQCYWQRTSTFGRWRTAQAECQWYKVREEIEAALKIVTQRNGRAGLSCVWGFRFRLHKGKPTDLEELIDQEWIADQQYLVVRIMPKCVTVPPRLRTISREVDPTLTEEERIFAMQGPRYFVERVGEEPKKKNGKTYVCGNCSSAGHSYRNCQWAKVEREPNEKNKTSQMRR